jgi:hypothetical protein
MRGNSKADFDWVSALSECSIGTIFEKLKLQIKNDVETRDRLLKDTPYCFKFESNHRDFSAILDGKGIHRSINFSLGERSISVSDGGNLMFEATVTLNDEGRCVARVNDQERELWQVRKMALEKLFFLSESRVRP